MVLVAIANFIILGFEGSINVWKELVVFSSLDKAITSKNSAKHNKCKVPLFFMGAAIVAVQ
jgi:hypothetical protein